MHEWVAVVWMLAKLSAASSPAAAGRSCCLCHQRSPSAVGTQLHRCLTVLPFSRYGKELMASLEAQKPLLRKQAEQAGRERRAARQQRLVG